MKLCNECIAHDIIWCMKYPHPLLKSKWIWAKMFWSCRVFPMCRNYEKCIWKKKSWQWDYEAWFGHSSQQVDFLWSLFHSHQGPWSLSPRPWWAVVLGPATHKMYPADCSSFSQSTLPQLLSSEQESPPRQTNRQTHTHTHTLTFRNNRLNFSFLQSLHNEF